MKLIQLDYIPVTTYVLDEWISAQVPSIIIYRWNASGFLHRWTRYRSISASSKDRFHQFILTYGFRIP